jgi:transcriptional regulator with GAF, ATPase, and Fis domain
MAPETTRKYSVLSWSPRARMYGGVISISLLYLLVGRLSSDDLTWVRVHLPMSAVSFLLVAVAGVEACLLLREWQDRHSDLAELRVGEQESALRITAQRLECVNEMAVDLLNYDATTVLAKIVPPKLKALFEADLSGVWTADDGMPPAFELQGLDGLDESQKYSLAVLTKCTPCFERIATHREPVIVKDFQRDTAPSLAGFCRAEGLVTAIFSPIWVGDNFYGVIGLFYKEPPAITAVYMAELQLVTHALAADRRFAMLHREYKRLANLAAPRA